MALTLMLFAITALASPSVAAANPTSCGLKSLTACRNASELVWTPPFQKAVQRLLGRRRADFFGGPGLAADQALEVLGGPPDPPAQIGSLYRFTACRANSCSENGAAVLKPDGQVVAIGVLHSACGVARITNDCFAHDTLDLFVRPTTPRQVVADLSAWAKAQVASEYVAPGAPPERLEAVRVSRVR